MTLAVAMLAGCQTPRHAANGTLLYPYRLDREIPPVVAVVDFEKHASWVINGGENVGLKIGDEFLARDAPHVVTDPVTGNAIEQQPGVMVGRTCLTEILPQSAHVKIVQGVAARGHLLEPIAK
ncbi:MAG: hypothetical protein EPN23_04250 [Verrucomicrobia bacterium]|nr:MAG: hypothetical protein EPN23_04250 [Verrucomicrobiota bacterium]